MLAGALAGLAAATAAQAADPHNPYYRYQQVQDLADHPLPLVATFTKGDEVLVFAAGKHKATLGAVRQKALEAVFKSARPAAVIVDGFPTAATQIPPQFLADKTSEASYVANLAIARHLPVIGGEPSDAEMRGDAGASNAEVAAIMRDRHIYNTILQALMSRKRILVVYGGEHWKTLSQPLGTALGLPSFQ